MAKQFLCKLIGHDYDISIVGEVGGSLRVVADQCTRCGHTTRSLRTEAIIQAIRPANDENKYPSGGSGPGLQPVVIRAGVAACTDRIGGAGVVVHNVVANAQSDVLAAEIERLREALEAAPLIGRTESVYDFMERQNAWLNGSYRAAMERSK